MPTEDDFLQAELRYLDAAAELATAFAEVDASLAAGPTVGGLVTELVHHVINSASSNARHLSTQCQARAELARERAATVAEWRQRQQRWLGDVEVWNAQRCTVVHAANPFAIGRVEPLPVELPLPQPPPIGPSWAETGLDVERIWNELVAGAFSSC